MSRIETNPDEVEPLAVTATVAGKMLGVSRWTIGRWIQSGRLRAIPTGDEGGRYIIPIAAIHEFLGGSGVIQHRDSA